MSHRIDHKDVAAMDATRGKYSSGGSVRAKKAFGDRITKKNIAKAADAIAPLAASFVTGSLAGAAAYEGGKYGVQQMMERRQEKGKDPLIGKGSKIRKRRKARKAARE